MGISALEMTIAATISAIKLRLQHDMRPLMLMIASDHQVLAAKRGLL